MVDVKQIISGNQDVQQVEHIIGNLKHKVTTNSWQNLGQEVAGKLQHWLVTSTWSIIDKTNNTINNLNWAEILFIIIVIVLWFFLMKGIARLIFNLAIVVLIVLALLFLFWII